MLSRGIPQQKSTFCDGHHSNIVTAITTAQARIGILMLQIFTMRHAMIGHYGQLAQRCTQHTIAFSTPSPLAAHFFGENV